MESPPPHRSNSAGLAAAFIAIAVILIVAFFALTNLSVLTNFFNIGDLSSGGPSANVSSQTVNGQTITEPPNYSTLVNYTLSLINFDRANYSGAPPVTLSPILSAQQHADSMLQYNYFSHWDVQGYLPYMRYTIMNGTGAVEENIAYESATGVLPAFNSIQSEENAIYTLEHDMMYNDYACCQNGHLLNIINPYHNRVSIGIAFNGNHLYLVEDFENYYINLKTPIFDPSSQNEVILQGTTNQSLDPDGIFVTWDPTPTPLNATILNSEYQKPYTPGNQTLGGVTRPCSSLCTGFFGITVTASQWKVTNSSIDIEFSLNRFISSEGSGVYTIYLTENAFASNSNLTETLTSLSIFIQT